ncbi:MAG: DNA repair protein RadA [Candidatus Cloacimonadota bacterium]|nr:MAG: DNA repair protein RadA [Candidatus Cloacimonadota bacterium]
MAKSKTIFFCQNCGAQSSKWIGKCPSCNEWNTYVEEVIQRASNDKSAHSFTQMNTPKPVKINEIQSGNEVRINTNDTELNRVLGGGLVTGSLVLVGGEPGIGKSTLLLQIALNLNGLRVLYITGEESEQQIKMRADRVGANNDDCYILAETLTQNIFQHIETTKPQLIVIDSIQTLHTNFIDSSAGSISQIRECASEFQKYAKITNTPVILIGHITKDGGLAGPKLLEHMVDTVLQFEGERNYGYRILRAVKNRFGSTSELGIYEMNDSGLRQVINPSEILISHRDAQLSGITIAAMMEGLRPMMIETQALVSTAAYGTPQRSSTGFDARRLNMLLAVLEKRCGFKLGTKDVFLNIAGGLKVDDPAMDLAIISSILSSNEDMPVDQNICFAGEIGLSGEIRSINRIDQRISEANKLGFEKIVISKYNQKSIDKNKLNIEIITVSKVDEVFGILFG